jgi:hypothetical protein
MDCYIFSSSHHDKYNKTITFLKVTKYFVKILFTKMVDALENFCFVGLSIIKLIKKTMSSS